MNNIISKKKYKLIEFVKFILGLHINHTVTENDVNKVKNIIHNHLYIDNLSPSDIKRKYNIEYTDFGMFIKKCLGLKLRNIKQGVNNYYTVSGKAVTDAKIIYKKNCKFKFDPFSITSIPGYDLLLARGVYNSRYNLNGVDRDHMLSVEYGWRNDIDFKIISHPANCQFLSHVDNMIKNDSSIISLEDLNIRIKNWQFSETVIIPIHKHLPKTESHKKKLSKANLGFIRITNGKENIRIKESDIIPTGYRRGFTRRTNMVD